MHMKYKLRKEKLQKLEGVEGANRSQILEIAQKAQNNHGLVEEANKRLSWAVMETLSRETNERDPMGEAQNTTKEEGEGHLSCVSDCKGYPYPGTGIMGEAMAYLSKRLDSVSAN